MFCKKCGAGLPNYIAFCSNCGAPVNHETKESIEMNEYLVFCENVPIAVNCNDFLIKKSALTNKRLLIFNDISISDKETLSKTADFELNLSSRLNVFIWNRGLDKILVVENGKDDTVYFKLFDNDKWFISINSAINSL